MTGGILEGCDEGKGGGVTGRGGGIAGRGGMAGSVGKPGGGAAILGCEFVSGGIMGFLIGVSKGWGWGGERGGGEVKGFIPVLTPSFFVAGGAGISIFGKDGFILGGDSDTAGVWIFNVRPDAAGVAPFLSASISPAIVRIL